MSNDAPLEGKGILVIFSAPSGCGKTSIVDRLMKRHPDWVRSISATTRAPRVDEKEGEHYFFLTPERFREMREAGHFLEFAEVHGHFYGTPREFVTGRYEKGATVILAIDVQGMAMVKKALNNQLRLLTVFILPPSLKVLRERLEGRKTDDAEAIERRLKIAEEEIKQADQYDRTVVNQNLEQAVDEIDEIIRETRKERS